MPSLREPLATAGPIRAQPIRRSLLQKPWSLTTGAMKLSDSFNGDSPPMNSTADEAFVNGPGLKPPAQVISVLPTTCLVNNFMAESF